MLLNATNLQKKKQTFLAIFISREMFRSGKTICCLWGFAIKFQLKFIYVFIIFLSFVNLFSRIEKLSSFQTWSVIATIWMFYVHVIHNQIYFVIMPRNYGIGDGLKLYNFFFFFLTLSKKKAATCFGYLANDKKRKKVPTRAGVKISQYLFSITL